MPHTFQSTQRSIRSHQVLTYITEMQRLLAGLAAEESAQEALRANCEDNKNATKADRDRLIEYAKDLHRRLAEISTYANEAKQASDHLVSMTYATLDPDKSDAEKRSR